MNKLILVFAVLFGTTMFSQIAHDNNTLTVSANPLSFTVPAGNEKLLVVVSINNNNNDLTFNPFNGVNFQYATSLNQVHGIWIAPLGDLATDVTADITYAESEKTLTVFSLNNVDQSNPISSFGYASGRGGILIHKGMNSKQPGDFMLNALVIGIMQEYCNIPNGVNSQGNSITKEYEFIFPPSDVYFVISSSLVTNSNEYNLWDIDDCTGIPDAHGSFTFTHQKSVIKYSGNTLRTSVFEQSSENFELFPNPSSDTLNFKKEINGTYVIYNTLGQRILESNTKGIVKEIDIKMLQPGAYLLKFTTQEKIIISQRFIKK